MATVLLVDDHAMIRRGIRDLLGTRPHLEVIAEAGTAAEATQALGEKVPDMVITDLVLLDGPDGIQLTKSIKAEYPEMPILMLSGHDEALFAERALVAGAAGYVMKEADLDVFLDAVDAVLNGDLWLSDDLRARMLPPVMFEVAVSCRDQADAAVLEQLAQGNRSVRGLCAALKLGFRQVERALDETQRKLRLPSRASLYLFAQATRTPAPHRAASNL